MKKVQENSSPLKKVVILGNPYNDIFHQIVYHFLQKNTEVYVIDCNMSFTHKNLKSVSASSYLSFFDRILLRIVPSIANVVDLLITFLVYGLSFRFNRIRQFWTLPKIDRPVSNMILYAKVLSRLKFDYALCLNVYFYGFCSILLKSQRIIAQPWGSDVNKYGVSTPLRFYFMKRCLVSVDYIAPAGRSVIPFMSKAYGIDDSKFVFLPPTVDDRIFHVISDEQRAARKSELNIPLNATVFFSCRRFLDGWGPHLIKDLFLKLVSQIPNSFFIVLSGSENNLLLEQFKAEVPEDKQKQFLFVNRRISLEEFGYYSQVSDFSVSAMTNKDMQSSSIMQSAACGAFPVLREQEEYRLMEDDGLDLIAFKEINNHLIKTIQELVNKPELLRSKRNNNQEYFASHAANRHYVQILHDL